MSTSTRFFDIDTTINLLVALAVVTVSAEQCAVTARTDCGYIGITQSECKSRQCCWAPSTTGCDCYYQADQVPIWNTISVTENINVSSGVITISINISTSNRQGQYGEMPSQLQVDITTETNERVRIRIFDPMTERWEIPQRLFLLPGPISARNPSYKVTHSQLNQEFSVQIVRISDSVTVFSTADLQFSDQFLQISNVYPNLNDSGHNIYGLGERVESFRLRVGETYTLWNQDPGGTEPFINSYGSHPFYLQLIDNGNAHGTYLHNSNGMDVMVQDDRVTFKTVGGVLDLFVFTGPSPHEVIQQYHHVIGHTHFPPYWALGWHQCRWGYTNVEEVKQVVANYSAAGIPLDTMWNDIDYMNARQDWTWDPVNYPEDQMKQFVEQLHANGQHYVVIVDPAIHKLTGYGPYDDGLKRRIFITEADGETPFTGDSTPGTATFPDFTDPAALDYWSDWIAHFLAGVPSDGLWIDMNEVYNANDGAPTSNSSFNNPPYPINNHGIKAGLNFRTLSMDALHYDKVAEYNIHNMYGLTESIATHRALENIRGKRSFVLSRSTFPSSGVRVAHWLGDNHSTWADLAASIAGILNMNMFGIPLSGVDICGFNYDTTEELCNRWQALGAFYPFTRNHNIQGALPQEPYRWASVTATAKKTLAARYSILPYLYTQFYLSNAYGGMVARPLFFDFPTDSTTCGIDTQYLLGPALLISPVVIEGATSVNAYFPPESNWYEFWTGKLQQSNGYQTLNTSIEHIQVHIRGGSIIPGQQPALTTTIARTQSYFLVVALNITNQARGELFIDDGESLDIGQEAVFISYFATKNCVQSDVLQNTYTSTIPSMDQVQVYGVTIQPSVKVNGQSWSQFTYDSINHILVVNDLGLSMSTNFQITW
ncbi:unnamed protein product [Didymodactylos carnosus]|uniref:alpha-glucosidase n=1 Tax=Didymodactylos carnosus TaxID=1234261 RepID=A0A814ME97_9BILA|nr:unnamed protein product [Didymodactylos carnosus]CAF1078171.1 unnamed protein product [Didymodactylos carnosus]CAF3555874.1 unnamed protein product [Didymodactylos carnosus]CAF3844391.1 unnamed protein product [Didymodactylos carnosus]